MLRAASSDVSIETQMLHCLADHGAGCYEEMRCTMPWCLFFMESLSLYSRYLLYPFLDYPYLILVSDYQSQYKANVPELVIFVFFKTYQK